MTISRFDNLLRVERLAPLEAADLLRRLNCGGSYAFEAVATILVPPPEVPGPSSVRELCYMAEQHIEGTLRDEARELGMSFEDMLSSWPYPSLPDVVGDALKLGWGRSRVSLYVGREIPGTDCHEVHIDVDLTAVPPGERESHPRHKAVMDFALAASR